MKRFALYFISDKYNSRMYNHETKDYGSFEHFAGYGSTLQTLRKYARTILKEHAEFNPRNFHYTDQDEDKPGRLTEYPLFTSDI